jgi:hypothetical protein
MQEKIIRELEESYEESRREKGTPHPSSKPSP